MLKLSKVFLLLAFSAISQLKAPTERRRPRNTPAITLEQEKNARKAIIAQFQRESQSIAGKRLIEGAQTAARMTIVQEEKEAVEQHFSCSICMQPLFDASNKKVCWFSCQPVKHWLHLSCAAQWFGSMGSNETCPTCRAPIDLENIDGNFQGMFRKLMESRRSNQNLRSKLDKSKANNVFLKAKISQLEEELKVYRSKQNSSNPPQSAIEFASELLASP